MIDFNVMGGESVVQKLWGEDHFVSEIIVGWLVLSFKMYKFS